MLLESFIYLILGCLVLTEDVAAFGSLEGSINERIFNGRNAKAGQFPYQALLIMANNDGNTSFCGGSLASTSFILTAAHCCAGVKSTKVYLGLVNVADANANFVQNFDVPSSSFIIHENYDPQTISNDICLLRLPTAAQLNANVSVVNLPTKQDNMPSRYDFRLATISGWGQTNDFEGLHSILQYSNVLMEPHIVCALEYTFINKVSNSQLCSGKLIWTGPCHGDSGGPLTIRDSSGKRVEVGLVSWGVGLCVGLHPVVYTYVPSYVDWLAKNMKG